ncbi:helix-turn-helix transcriptional regulator [Pyramidobacter piscolens]|uniref:helix-turn-helix transcriptional regulator n=1 Tax=Pyramidobacter piscolens TaxID=638849 RepID=UPI003CD0DF7D
MGKKLRAYRKANGLTLAELAKKVDSSLEYMHEIETGKARPSLAMLERLSRVLDFRLDLLDAKEGKDVN